MKVKKKTNSDFGKTLKHRKIFDKLKLLNPKNLEKEVHVYGYNFSWKSHILFLVCSLLGISAIGVLFKLQPVYFAVNITVVLLMLPVLILDMYKKMFEQKRFADVAAYMEQMLYSFQKSGKVILALKESREIFEDGQMREAIDAAVRYLESGTANTKRGILSEALELIEEPYECVKLHTVHELLVNSEEHGGDTERSILLVLEDLELWKRRGYKLQADKKTSHMDNIISIVVATVLCAVALYVLDGMRKLFAVENAFDMFQVGIIQVSSVIFILFQLYVLARSSKNLTANWLQENMLHDADDIFGSYETVVNFDDSREKRKSIIFAAPFIVASVPLLFFSQKWIGILCIVVAAFMLMQHRIGYNLAKKDINNEMYAALPQWLMQIALLLQHNNVQVAIARSAEGAPVVLRTELIDLIGRLQKEPEKLKTYTDFCSRFDIPEMLSCMKMLHAISESGTGNARVQVNNLIQRVNEMQNMADDIKNQNMAFRMKLIFSYPVLAATVKLLIDLTVGMLYMFQMLGGMGMGGA